jgi:hypothetical protein
MKSIHLIIFALSLMGISVSCGGQSAGKETGKKITASGKVEVYYFHFTNRCVTCNAVESVASEAIAEYYGNKVSFHGYNLDEAEGKNKSAELGVSGQSLLVVAGDTKINLTNEGFLNARTNPDKFKQIIKEKIDPLL